MPKFKSQHLLQSEPWSKFQNNLNKKSIMKSGKGWCYTAYLETGYGKLGSLFSRLYVPYGPTYKDELSLYLALRDLENEAKAQDVDYIRIEPICAYDNAPLLKHIAGYKKLAHSFQPDLTLIIDLDKNFDEILGDMSKTNRYLWKKSKANGLEFNITYSLDKIEMFLDMMDATAVRTGTIFAKADYFNKLFSCLVETKNAGLVIASYEGKPLVSSLFIDNFDSLTRYYMYAGSYDEARKYSANAPLVVFLIENAKKQGLEHFDLFGISPKNLNNHKWAGFSKFKRLFGGREVEYSGTWEKPIKVVRYNAMSLARKFASN